MLALSQAQQRGAYACCHAQELRSGVARRGFHVSDALVLSTFDSADMDSNHTIDFKVQPGCSSACPPLQAAVS